MQHISKKTSETTTKKQHISKGASDRTSIKQHISTHKSEMAPTKQPENTASKQLISKEKVKSLPIKTTHFQKGKWYIKQHISSQKSESTSNGQNISTKKMEGTSQSIRKEKRKYKNKSICYWFPENIIYLEASPHSKLWQSLEGDVFDFPFFSPF